MISYCDRDGTWNEKVNNRKSSLNIAVLEMKQKKNETDQGNKTEQVTRKNLPSDWQTSLDVSFSGWFWLERRPAIDPTRNQLLALRWLALIMNHRRWTRLLESSFGPLNLHSSPWRGFWQLSRSVRDRTTPNRCRLRVRLSTCLSPCLCDDWRRRKRTRRSRRKRRTSTTPPTTSCSEGGDRAWRAASAAGSRRTAAPWRGKRARGTWSAKATGTADSMHWERHWATRSTTPVRRRIRSPRSPNRPNFGSWRDSADWPRPAGSANSKSAAAYWVRGCADAAAA